MAKLENLPAQDWLLHKFMYQSHSHSQYYNVLRILHDITCVNIHYILYVTQADSFMADLCPEMSRVDSHECHVNPMASPRLFVEKAMIRIQVKSLTVTTPHGT